MIIRQRPPMGDLGWNPFKKVAAAARATGRGVATGARYTGKGAVAVGKRKEFWAAALVAGGTAIGIPPAVTMPFAAAILKSGGKPPPGSDPRLLALLAANPPPKTSWWDDFLGWLGVG